MSNYLIKPNSIRKSDILQKSHSLHPSEHKKIRIPNTNLKPISELIKSEGVGEQINVNEYLNFNTEYILATISNMHKCIFDEKQGEKISPSIYNSSSKQLIKGDILISRNASLGKITLVDKNIKAILNGGISYLRLAENLKYYLFTFFLLDYGTDYLTVLTSGGGTQKNAKRQNLLDTKIPFPTGDNHKSPELIVQYVSHLSRNIINKEIQIELNQNKIDVLIEKELNYNDQGSFKYKFPTKNTLKNESRLDTGLYNEKFKKIENSIINYKGGYSNLFDLGFSISRGQNLQISAIGKSYYSDYKINESFTRLILSSQISNNAVLIGENYLGNKNKLKYISKGDIIFCSRGAQFGRITIFPEDIKNTITNIDNLHIQNKKLDLRGRVTICMIINHLRKIGYLKKIAIFGNGSFSFTKYQFQRLQLPVFSESLENTLYKYYFNTTNKVDCNLNNYLEEENKRNAQLGIYQLNSEIIELKHKLKETVDKIINKKSINLEL